MKNGEKSDKKLLNEKKRYRLTCKIISWKIDRNCQVEKGNYIVK